MSNDLTGMNCADDSSKCRVIPPTILVLAKPEVNNRLFPPKMLQVSVLFHLYKHIHNEPTFKSAINIGFLDNASRSKFSTMVSNIFKIYVGGITDTKILAIGLPIEHLGQWWQYGCVCVCVYA